MSRLFDCNLRSQKTNEEKQGATIGLGRKKKIVYLTHVYIFLFLPLLSFPNRNAINDFPQEYYGTCRPSRENLHGSDNRDWTDRLHLMN